MKILKIYSESKQTLWEKLPPFPHFLKLYMFLEKLRREDKCLA